MSKRIRPLELTGAHALVTGAARGIGRATARRLLTAGASVSLWDLDATTVAETARSFVDEEGYDAESIHHDVVDISDFSTLDDAVSRCVQSLGPIDVLVNNAGHLGPGSFVDQEAEVWMRTLNINVNALVYLTRLVIPAMYERKKGHIINISSAAGTIGVPRLAVYSASKWAVWGFTEALRGEAAEYGVAVSSIHPSYIATGMFAGAHLHGLGNLIVPRLADHDAVAEAIVEGALKKGGTRVLRPRSVRLAILLRGILPDRWFNGLMQFLGVWDSMRGWHGRGEADPTEGR